MVRPREWMHTRLQLVFAARDHSEASEPADHIEPVEFVGADRVEDGRTGEAGPSERLPTGIRQPELMVARIVQARTVADMAAVSANDPWTVMGLGGVEIGDELVGGLGVTGLASLRRAAEQREYEQDPRAPHVHQPSVIVNTKLPAPL